MGISDDLVVGLVLGVVLGLLAGPLLRSWLIWREWSSASRAADERALREADLIADVLERMEADLGLPVERDEDRQGAAGAKARTQRPWRPR